MFFRPETFTSFWYEFLAGEAAVNKAHGLSLIERAGLYRERTAIVDCDGEHTYGQLLDASARVATTLLGLGDFGAPLEPQSAPSRVPYYVTPGFAWVAVQWGIWRAGGIAVPLPLGSPAAELEYFIGDTQAAALVCDLPGVELLAPIAAARGLRLLTCDELLASRAGPLPVIENTQPAMILYTSGTTSRPKGVVSTHANIEAQITTLVRAWQWSEADRILLCLPLHHVHGIINVVCCALWSGAACEMLPRFDAGAAWDRIARGGLPPQQANHGLAGDPGLPPQQANHGLAGDPGLTLFMAVPTIYSRLISAWEAASPERRELLSQACGRLRLMVSGSAALPVATLNRWREISGHTLLERYGMTEIGMALSNPLAGPRVAGSVGTPLPGVEVRLVDEQGGIAEAGTPGEIEVRGPGVFTEYWGKPEATRQAFRDGWFRTGDVAVVEDGRYRILGRINIDIIKTGGHKVSALEIEEQLREHPAIAECAVVGLPDPEWGERVAAAIVLREGVLHEEVLREGVLREGALREVEGLDLAGLRNWSKERLPAYKVPSRLLVVDALPRNAMGKVTKPAVVELFGVDRFKAGHERE